MRFIFDGEPSTGYVGLGIRYVDQGIRMFFLLHSTAHLLKKRFPFLSSVKEHCCLTEIIVQSFYS